MKLKNFTEVSSFEAKTNLSQLLRRVSKGEKIVILKHNSPIAVISPFDKTRNNNVLEVVNSLKLFSKGKTLKGILLEDLVKEGQK
jgi:prevent-host-death family protein